MTPPRSAAEIAERIATLRVAFAEQIPVQLDTLRKLHAETMTANWAREKVNLLLGRIHEFTGAATTFGFSELGEASRVLELGLRETLTHAEIDAARIALANAQFDSLLALPIPDPTHLAPLLPPRLDHLRTERDPGHRLIYLADDNPLVTEQLAEQIRYFGYEVQTFNRLEDFAVAYRNKPPAAVVLDIEFPEEEDTGPSLFGRLMHERGESTPAVFISSHDDIHSRLSAARAGGNRYLLKPVIIGDLIDALDGLLTTSPPMPYRVLIVDDSHAIGQLYAGILEGAGMKVEVTTNPLAALDILAEFHPDLALIDLYMPECSGQELATVIRQVDAYVGLPIVFLSAETDRKRQLTALQLGADDFLTKPVQPDFLIASIATRAERARQVRGLIHRDSLTGLLNHSSFLEAANTELARARRNQVPIAVAMVDLDHFKAVNDRHGHPAGDRVLRSVARQLRQRLRTVDVIGRYGGEEFAIIFSGTDARSALRVLNNIREDFSKVAHSSVHGTFHVSFSAGVAGYPDFEELSELIEAADHALYDAKNRGRNTAVLAAPIASVAAPLS